MKIEIKSNTVSEETIKPSGKEGAKVFTAFTKVNQTAYVHGMVDRNGSPEAFPVKISLNLGTKEDHAPPYAVGFYEIASESFFVDRFDVLCLGRLSLRPLASQLKAAA